MFLMHIDSGIGEDQHIRINHIAKTEGHSNLDIKVKDNKVEYVKLKITESKRFYTQAIRGKNAMSVPLLTSRICGTCSIAHLTCCTEAVEHAIGYIPSDQTIILRKLTMNGMMIRDHALHLFIFCLPDIFNKDSVLDFDKAQDELVRKAFAIKGAGNNLSKVIAGRAIHATYAEVGKFSHIPAEEDVSAIVKELKSVREYAIEFIELFAQSTQKVERSTNYVALVSKDYSFIGGNLKDSEGLEVKPEGYWNHINRTVIPYSQSSGYNFKGKEYMVGALARMNLNKANINKKTKADIPKYMDMFPSTNVYANNIAQAIEILHCIDNSIDILEGTEFVQEVPKPVKINAGKGAALIEAPRGTLAYLLEIDATGKITNGNIIVPTSQNQTSMEKSVAELVENSLHLHKHEIEHKVEEMIRAYDPCMSCASHFLNIKWH